MKILFQFTLLSWPWQRRTLKISSPTKCVPQDFNDNIFRRLFLRFWFYLHGMLHAACSNLKLPYYDLVHNGFVQPCTILFTWALVPEQLCARIVTCLLLWEHSHNCTCPIQHGFKKCLYTLSSAFSFARAGKLCQLVFHHWPLCLGFVCIQYPTQLASFYYLLGICYTMMYHIKSL